jgi:small-conductance mechanosensitive channel
MPAIPKEFQVFLDYKIGETTVHNILIAIALFIALILVFKIFRQVILKKIEKLTCKTKYQCDKTIVSLLEKIPAYFYWAISAFTAFHLVNLSNHPTAHKIINGFFSIIVVYQAIVFAENFAVYLLKNKLGSHDENEIHKNQTTIHGLMIIVKILLWSAGLLLILNNMGVKVGTLIASLGIGGVAIAFALQSILSDLFSSFAIYFDKPFEIGDYVVIGDDSGTVKKIGMKTTRITTLQGEELVVSNADLTSTRIKNFKKMKKRRIAFGFGVTYSTPSAKMKKIPDIVGKIIEKVELAEFNRCHFKEFADSSLNYEVIYFIKNRDYNDYMDAQEEINLAIKAAFEKEKIDMAFPSRTIYIAK